MSEYNEIAEENMEIIYSGGNHYGKGALKSLQKRFNKIYILRDNPADIISLKRQSDILINDFSDSSCKYVFLAGHSSFITDKQLSEKTYINVHGALLPKYRGMHPTFWAIMNDEKKLGITFHLVNKYMDAGDIIAQYNFDYYGQSIQDINNTIDILIEEHSGSVIFDFLSGLIIPKKQNDEEATFGCKRNLDDCLIDFNMDNEILKRFFKALTPPYPLPRIMFRGTIYEVIEYKIIYREYFSAIGRVLNIDDDGVWIKTKEGFLIIKLIKNVETNELLDSRKILRIGHRLLK